MHIRLPPHEEINENGSGTVAGGTSPIALTYSLTAIESQVAARAC